MAVYLPVYLFLGGRGLALQHRIDVIAGLGTAQHPALHHIGQTDRGKKDMNLLPQLFPQVMGDAAGAGLGAALGRAGLAAGGGNGLVHRHDDVGDAQLARAATGDSRRRARARW